MQSVLHSAWHIGPQDCTTLGHAFTSQSVRMVQPHVVQWNAWRAVQGGLPHAKMSINVSHYYYCYRKKQKEKEKLIFLCSIISPKVLRNMIVSEASKNNFYILMALTVMF